MKRILVAYDGSFGADLAINDLARAGLPERAEAKVITIADVWLPPMPVSDENIFSGHPSFAAHEKASELLRDAKKTAIQAARRLHEIYPDWTVSNSARADSPAWEIIAEARRWRGDLIVIGSHGRSPLERFFLGSVSYKVAAEAHCSVRIVRPGVQHDDGHLRLLIGLDGSEDARRAIDEVLTRRWGGGTEVELVTVIDPKLKSSVLGKKGLFEKENVLERIEDWIEPMFEQARARFASKEIHFQSHIFEGDPKAVILRHAEEKKVDAIFLGARGLDHGDRLYLGTLASAISTRAHCTVELVRSPVEVETPAKTP